MHLERILIYGIEEFIVVIFPKNDSQAQMDRETVAVLWNYKQIFEWWIMQDDSLLVINTGQFLF